MFLSSITAIYFASLLSSVRNTVFMARPKTTWWNGKATSTRGSAFRSTVSTATIASQPEKCWLISIFSWLIFKMSGRAITRSFGRCLSVCAPARKQPFINAEALCCELNNSKLPGVFFRENYFEPTFHKFTGELCGGAQLYVLDREAFRPFLTGVEIIKRIRKIYSEQFQWKQPPYEYEWKRLPIEVLIGGPIDSIFCD